MKFLKTEKVYVVRLFKGEKIVETLTQFCKSENISSGVFSGIGGAENIELGYYSLKAKTYYWRTFEKMHEIASINGNVTMVEDAPFLHIHMVITSDTFETFGGHLKDAVVGATCEIFLTELHEKIKRTLDDDIGLKLMNFEKEVKL